MLFFLDKVNAALSIIFIYRCFKIGKTVSGCWLFFIKFKKVDIIKKKYIEEVLGPKDTLWVVIEANTGQQVWYQLLNDSSYTVFMKSFGKSAPGQQLADYFGFTPEKIAQKIIKLYQSFSNTVSNCIN